MDCSDKEMVYHHAFVIFGLYSGLAYNSSANEMLRALIVAEVSNSCMHSRMIMRNYNQKYSAFYLYLELYYLFTYIPSRLLFGSKVVFFTVFCMNNLLIVKLAGLFIWLQSVYFTKRMVGIIINRYNEYKERKQRNVKLFWFEFNKKLEDLEYYKKSIKKEEYIP